MRILFLHRREWLHPRAGPVEHGLHRLLAPIADQGVHITWLAHQYRQSLRFGHALRTEMRDGIELARLGHVWFYPAMVGLFLRQWEQHATGPARYDIAVECVDGHLLGAAAHTPIPVLPLVVRAPSGSRVRTLLHGPIAVIGEDNARILQEAGALPVNVLTLPAFPAGPTDIAAWRRLSESTLAALEIFAALSAAVPPA